MSKKRGSLELSINAIVIIVLAFVLLGLGLGFIRNQFKSMSGTTAQVQEQVKQQILDDLRTGDKKLSFPSTRVLVEKGGTIDLAIGIKNTQASGSMKFYIDVFTAQDQTNKVKCDEFTEGAAAFEEIPLTLSCNFDDLGLIPTDSGTIEDIKFFLDSGPYNLGIADAEVYPISITAAKASNTYLVKIRIYVEDEATLSIDPIPYAEKTFYVQVG